MAEDDEFHNKEDGNKKLWGIVLFSLIGATATTFAVGQLRQFGRTVDWISAQMSRMQSQKGGSGSFRSSFQEEARRRYRQRMQEEYEEELERVMSAFADSCSLLPSRRRHGGGFQLFQDFEDKERIRRMQSVFNRERNKYKRSYESWRDNETGGYNQHFQREDWYWTAESSFRDRKANYKQTPQHRGSYSLSRHYAVLGLDRLRTKPYTDDEIKSAFRAKALEYHPDQNQGNKEVAEEKFKEVMMSYEAIKSERKNAK
uniref:J domain-containing protein n=1 Tax=Chenopodium quinoa TaxID=63459 RepID=A0A803N2J5_CHEQI